MVTTLKLSKVSFGVPRQPDNGPYEYFLNRLHDRKYDYITKQHTQTLFFRHAEIPNDASVYHRNYLEYLEKCWADHLGVVITPDIMWFTVLSELVSLVKESPETYRDLFSESQEKKSIIVLTENPIVMPLNRLVGALRKQVPTDANLFMPEFSTTSEKSRHAHYSIFCDMCSPYYNYMMLMCGFPAIHIQGTNDDWRVILDKWNKLCQLFCSTDDRMLKAGSWMAKTGKILLDCVSNLENAEWWKNIFKLEKCGSGHQTTTSGWFTELFRIKPQIAYVENFSSHVAQVDYEFLPTHQKYKLQEGLFYSYQEGDFMVPDFGYTVHEKVTEE